jgi:hypothetical protein
MTNEEVQKLIAGMRDDLRLLAATTDVEKLVVLVEEKLLPMMQNFFSLVRQRPEVFGEVWIYGELVEMPLTRIIGAALSKRIDRVAKEVSMVDSTLEQIIQALQGHGSMPTLPDKFPPAPEPILKSPRLK